MRIELINLDRSADRRTSFAAANRHLTEVCRFHAADGEQLSEQEIFRAGLVQPELRPYYTRGALGCAISHLTLWERARSEGVPLTTCEDDAVLHRKFEAHAAAELARLSSTWDIIFWGCNCGAHILFEPHGDSHREAVVDRERTSAALAAFQDQEVQPQLQRLRQMLGLVCYSISPKGADILLRLCLPLRPMQVHFDLLKRTLSNQGLDIAMNEHYPKLQAFVAIPPLALSPNDPDKSTVQTQPGR